MCWKKFSLLLWGVCALAFIDVQAAEKEEIKEDQPADSLFLTVDELFRLGVENSLRLQADALDEAMAYERGKTARTSRLPDLQIGLRGGVVGQPVVFQRGLSDAVRPDTPDWSQNYAIDLPSRFTKAEESATPSGGQTCRPMPPHFVPPPTVPT